MVGALKRHWPEYLMEAAGLGIFMISACWFAVILEYPGSPVRQAIDDTFLRRILMGVAMGLTAVSIIYSPWGKQSGAHINPSVTLTFWRLGKVASGDALFYILAQFTGGAAGVLLATTLFRRFIEHPAVAYVATVPGPGGPGVAFVAELIISLILMSVVLRVSNTEGLAQYTGLFAGALVATYITFEAPLSGMSMNPARTFGSALVARLWTALWVYFTAPPIGMLLAAEIFLYSKGRHAVSCAKLHHQNNKRCIFCDYHRMQRALPVAALVVLIGVLSPSPAYAESRGEVYHLRRGYNFATRRHFPQLYRQLAAAPFVHTLLVQLLIDRPVDARERAAEYDRMLAERIRRHALDPPTLPPAEDVLAPSWPRMAWKVVQAMEWTHVLHDQLIDILADDRVEDKKAAIAQAIAYYLDESIAITPRPLQVELMSRYPYSHEFHHAYQECMGIMMAYHWLQGAQYEAMLSPREQRGQAVEEALAHFRGLLQQPPDHFPLTHKAAPSFHRLAPEAGYIFDNLHMLHHLAQDILISQKVQDKRAELYRLLPLFLNRSASPEWFAAGPQEEPLMPGAAGHRHHAGVHP